MDGLNYNKIQLPKGLRPVNVWESAASIIEEMATNRAMLIEKQNAAPQVKKVVVPTGKNVKKTDLIRLSIDHITQDSLSFTFSDIYSYMQGCIDKQTVSALVNRLYATGELVSDTRASDGCLNYAVKMLRPIPEWMDAISIEDAICAFVDCSNEREIANTNDPSIQSELTCGDSFIQYMNDGMDHFLEPILPTRRYVIAMD